MIKNIGFGECVDYSYDSCLNRINLSFDVEVIKISKKGNEVLALAKWICLDIPELKRDVIINFIAITKISKKCSELPVIIAVTE